MSGTIYYISCNETSRVKIGFTKGNVTKRLKALQTGSTTKLGILAAHSGTMDEEKALHRKFANCHVRGEWFDATDDDLYEHIVMVVVDIFDRAFDAGKKPPAWTVGVLKVLNDHGVFGETVQ